MKRALMTVRSKKELLYAGSILFFLVIVNHRVMNTWFIVDDTANIFCSSFNPLKLLFDRGVYLYFNQMFYTPLLPISFRPDWLLFRLNPLGYHISNLIAAYLCCLCFYKLQRLYLPPFLSWVGTILLAVSLPMSFDIGWVTRKHYLWGFFFALSAVYLFKRWEGKSNYLLFFSLASALVSFLFKEAYASLPAIIFLISSGSLRDRIKKTVPYLFPFALYLFLRLHILGSLGGYPGSTDKSIVVFIGKLLSMQMDLSDNLFGFPFVFLAVLLVLAFFNFRVSCMIAVIATTVISPLVFFPAGGFPLANKALPFVAVVSFALMFTANQLSLRRGGIFLLFYLMLVIPLLFGSLSRIRGAQNLIIHLSDDYEKVSREIMKSRDKTILIVGNYAYYFSNLEDIQRRMSKEGFPSIKSISDTMILPYMDPINFDKVIVIKNLDLDPNIAFNSSIEVIEGEEAKQFVREKLREHSDKAVLPPPAIQFGQENDRLRITVNDPRDGTYVRCLSIGSYVGCAPIPRNYIYSLNKVKKVKRIDIIYVAQDGLMSAPSSIIF